MAISETKAHGWRVTVPSEGRLAIY